MDRKGSNHKGSGMVGQIFEYSTPLVGPYSIGVLLLSYYQTISKKEVFLALIWLMLHSLLN